MRERKPPKDCLIKLLVGGNIDEGLSGGARYEKLSNLNIQVSLLRKEARGKSRLEMWFGTPGGHFHLTLQVTGQTPPTPLLQFEVG